MAKEQVLKNLTCDWRKGGEGREKSYISPRTEGRSKDSQKCLAYLINGRPLRQFSPRNLMAASA